MFFSIPDSLKTLGLEEKEACVYRALLTLQKGSVLAIARAAGIKRPTTYHILEALRKKNLVTKTMYRRVMDYRLLPVDHLKSYVRRQKTMADTALPAIQKLYNERHFKLRLRIYSDLSGIKVFLEKSLRERSPLFVLGNETRIQETLGPYWEFYIKRAQQLSILPRFKTYQGTQLFLWSDKVAFVELGDHPKIFAFKNESLHALYQKLWNRS